MVQEWCHQHLNPVFNKTAWTKEEDLKLVETQVTKGKTCCNQTYKGNEEPYKRMMQLTQAARRKTKKRKQVGSR